MAEIGETFFASDRQTWRAWLAEHHASAREIWLLFYKKHTGVACVSLDEAVEEALCFGWIDGKLRRIDDEKHALRFGPRRPGSIWAQSNKARVRKLIAEGRMTPAGLALVRAAKKSGEWQKATLRENVRELPPELRRALDADPVARDNWDAMAPSHRRAYIYWVSEAKRDATRQRRIAEVVLRVARNTAHDPRL